MPKLKIDEVKITEAIDRVVERTFLMDHIWDWPAGVACYGVSRAYEATGNKAYLHKLQEWVDAEMKEGLPPLTVNAVSLGHTLIDLYEYTNDEKYISMAKEMSEFLAHKAERFADGVLQHTVSQHFQFPEQAWVDTMFMAGYFLIRMGHLLGREDYLEDGLKQYHGHEDFLQDNQTNLFYHGWDHIGQSNMSSVYWARGNSWAAYTMSRALQYVPVDHPSYMKIFDSLRDQLSALVRLQAEDGMWHTVLNDPESYTETSGSTGIAAALVYYNKEIGRPLYSQFIQNAISGVLEHVSEDGTVLKVSAGTAVMRDKDGYKHTPNKRIQGWGQGLALVFLSSLLQTADKEVPDEAALAEQSTNV